VTLLFLVFGIFKNYLYMIISFVLNPNYIIYFFPIYYKHSDTLGAQSMEPATLRVLSHMIALPRLEHVSAKAIIVCHSEPGAALPPLLTLLATVTT